MTPQHHNQASRHYARTWVRLCAAGLIGLSAPVATAAMLGMSPQAVAQIPEETPEQRCQRETQQYNQAQAAAWQATHPGQAVPTPPPWPPYVCVGGPQIDAGAPAGGGADTRPDRWDGQSIAGNRPQGWSDTGVGVGAPRRGIARTPADPTAPSALESARSNITQPVAQVTIDTGDGGTRQVIAAGDGPRRIVVDAAGRTTGQILAVTSDGQARIIADESVPAGIDADDAIADGGARATIGTDGDDAGEVGQARTDDVDVVAAEVTKQGYETAAMAAAAAAAAAGALAAAAGLRGGRHARTLPRVIPAAGAAGGGVPPTPWAGTSAQFGWIQPDGDRQRFVVMSDENSARDHRFDMDVPDGGQMVKNPDGSVDVIDADGTVVDHVKAPWAYDAAGRPVDTWYEVDNNTGELVQHVAPDESTVFPIIADPEQSKTAASKKSKTQSAKKSQSNVIDPKTRAAMDRSQAGKNAADKQKAKSNPQPKPAPKTAPKQKAVPKPATTQKPAAAPAKTAPKQTAATNPAPAKSAPKETPQQQKTNDAQRAQRQPGFVGPVTAEDKAGQKRNQQRIDNNKHAAVSAGNNDPAKIPDTDTTKPVQAAPSTPRPTPSQQQQRASSPDDELFLGKDSPYATGATEREINGPSSARRGNIDSLSPEGDHISRGADGRVNVHADDATTVTTNRDGSKTVTEGGRTTTYYPTTRGEITDKMQIESSTYDADSNETRQVFIKPDGSRVEQRRPGKQQVNGPSNSRAQHSPIATPKQPVADIDYRQPDRGTQQGQIEVHHRGAQPGQGTIDVVPAEGQPVTVDAETGAVKHLGTTDHPVQGPVTPEYYNPRTGTIEPSPSTNRAPSDIMGPTFGQSDIASGIYSVGTDTAFETAKESAKSLGTAGDDLAKAARIGGRGFGAAGGVIGAEIDRNSGMDPTEAYVTNGIGVAAAIGTGALIAAAPISVPIVLGAVAAGTAGFAATKVSQAIWSQATK